VSCLLYQTLHHACESENNQHLESILHTGGILWMRGKLDVGVAGCAGAVLLECLLRRRCTVDVVVWWWTEDHVLSTPCLLAAFNMPRSSVFLTAWSASVSVLTSHTISASVERIVCEHCVDMTLCRPTDPDDYTYVMRLHTSSLPSTWTQTLMSVWLRVVSVNHDEILHRRAHDRCSHLCQMSSWLVSGLTL